MNKIIILNGPNLNLLGEREKNQYGSLTLEDIEKKCKEFASKNNIHLSLYQSNIEGELIEVTHGPLKGIIATSIEHQRNYRLIIQFESIGRQFVVHVSRSQVRKVKDKIA